MSVGTLGWSDTQEAPTPMEILSAFKTARLSTPTYSAKISIAQESSGDAPHARSGQWRMETDFVDDGERFRAVSNRYNIEGDTETLVANYSKMWDGNKSWLLEDMVVRNSGSIRKGKPRHHLLLNDDPEKSRRAVQGIVGYDPRGRFRTGAKYLFDLMADPEKLAGGEMEEISGNPCYHITFSKGYSEYELWMDPASDYQLRRARMTIDYKKAKDEGKQLIGGSNLPESVLEEMRNLPDERSTYELKDVTIEQIGNQFFPTSYKVTSATEMGDGSRSVYEQMFVLSDLEFGDHLVTDETFRLDVPDETAVTLVGASQIDYVWRAGEIVPSVDSAELKQLDESVAMFASDTASSPLAEGGDLLPSGGPSIEIDGGFDKPSGNTVAVVFGLLALGALSIVTWRYTQKPRV